MKRGMTREKGHARSLWEIGAVVTAATVGDAVFALPYVFLRSGWAVGVIYLVGLAALVAFAQAIYLKTLAAVGEKERLLGLVKKYLPPIWFWIGFVAIIIGLFLGLVAYLVLGSKFITLAVPGLSFSWALLLFWVAVSAPLLLSDRRIVNLELLGIIATTAVIVVVFGKALPHVGFQGMAFGSSHDLFLPFGVILIALAGWTGIEPAYDIWKTNGRKAAGIFWVAFGTFFAGLLYLLFTMGIFGSGASVTSDTVSGLQNFPAWERLLVSILGAVAIWTAYIPLSREIKNALQKDLKWNPARVELLLIAFPVLVVVAGINDFFAIISVAGGVFIALQYWLIVSVARKVLKVGFLARCALGLVALFFAATAVYSLYAFIVR